MYSRWLKFGFRFCVSLHLIQRYKNKHYNFHRTWGALIGEEEEEEEKSVSVGVHKVGKTI